MVAGGAILLVLASALGIRASRRSDTAQFTTEGVKSRLRSVRATPFWRRYRFSLFSKGRPRRIEGALSGDIDGRPAWVARYSHHHWAPPLFTARRNFVIAIVDVASEIPAVSVEPQTMWGDLTYGVGMSLYTTESDEFNLLFHVSTESEQAGSWLLNPKVIAWLVDKARGYGFELNNQGVLCYVESEIDTPEPRVIVSMARDFLDTLPDELISRYGFEQKDRSRQPASDGRAAR